MALNFPKGLGKYHNFERNEDRATVFLRWTDFSIEIDSWMKIRLEQIKGNNKCNGGEKSGFVDSGFVKTCDELVIGSMEERFSFVEETTSSYTSTTMKLELK